MVTGCSLAAGAPLAPRDAHQNWELVPNSGARNARPSGGKNPPLARIPSVHTGGHGTRAPAERVPKRPHFPARHVHFWERTRSCDTCPLSLDSNRVSMFCAVRRPGAIQAAALKRLYVQFSRVRSRRQAMLVRSPIHTSHAWVYVEARNGDFLPRSKTRPYFRTLDWACRECRTTTPWF